MVMIMVMVVAVMMVAVAMLMVMVVGIKAYAVQVAMGFGLALAAATVAHLRPPWVPLVNNLLLKFYAPAPTLSNQARAAPAGACLPGSGPLGPGGLPLGAHSG
jgi:hypothetical protein